VPTALLAQLPVRDHYRPTSGFKLPPTRVAHPSGVSRCTMAGSGLAGHMTVTCAGGGCWAGVGGRGMLGLGCWAARGWVGVVRFGASRQGEAAAEAAVVARAEAAKQEGAERGGDGAAQCPCPAPFKLACCSPCSRTLSQISGSGQAPGLEVAFKLADEGAFAAGVSVTGPCQMQVQAVQSPLATCGSRPSARGTRPSRRASPSA
jgi:hypothetical protein